jgi:hypothetical protein
MPKREPRNTKKKPDIMKPFDVSMFGTDDDPCFGKHYDIQAPECASCGDREICSIVLAQNMHKLRAKAELAIGGIMDKEMPHDLPIEPVRVKKTILKNLKPGKWVEITEIRDALINEFDISKAEALGEIRRIIKEIKTKENISYNKPRTKLRKNQ